MAFLGLDMCGKVPNRKESGVLHVAGIFILLLLIGAVFLFMSYSQNVPTFRKSISGMEQQVESLQRRVDSLEARVKMIEMKQGL